ncbi:F-box/kelch-repeat protein [Pyrus ussuriensis x Pyrus communis]|uniref:F-box/kelch-repeat protein n=1 Tax=Pyrus ussuriensis x Pyrus communis TaxID=2448454 RepID=A0A5N5FG58_9ROSA|nr:F-box/kelch-repeat protein [Pyrus ussuriensis x Pyrus communis]
MFGSCNGLACIVPQPKSFFVFNRCSTAVSFKMPDCPIPIHVCPEPVTCSRPHPHVHSFGHTPSTDDYKFVKVAYGGTVLVLSLKTNSWTRVQDFPSIFWIVTEGHLSMELSICHCCF